MTKKDIINKVAKEYNVSKDDTSAWIDAILDAMSELIAEEDLTIYNFGAFRHINRAPRVGRHVVTGERINIPSKTIIKFEPYSGIKKAMSKKGGAGSAETDESED